MAHSGAARSCMPLRMINGKLKRYGAVTKTHGIHDNVDDAIEALLESEPGEIVNLALAGYNFIDINDRTEEIERRYKERYS